MQDVAAIVAIGDVPQAGDSTEPSVLTTEYRTGSGPVLACQLTSTADPLLEGTTTSVGGASTPVEADPAAVPAERQ